MKNTTPMQKLKHHIQLFKKNTGRVFTKNYTLNKKSPYYNAYGGPRHSGGIMSQGIGNDFLHIFENTEQEFSVGFVYNYINREEKDWKVQVTFKPETKKHGSFYNTSEEYEKDRDYKNAKILTSKQMSVETFRQKMKNLNNNLENQSIKNVADVLDSFVGEFFDNSKDIKQQLQESEKEAIDFLKEKEQKYKQLLKTNEQHEKDLKEARKKIKMSLHKTKQYTEMKELEERLKNLKESVNNKQKEYEEHYQLKRKEDAFQKSSDELLQLGRTLDDKKINAIKNNAVRRNKMR